MNTPSHWLMTAGLRKYLQWPLPGAAVLWGSIAPDIPLYMLSFGGMFYYRTLLGWSDTQTFHHLFDDLYFHHPFWIASHNLLHSPTLLLLGLIVLWRWRHSASQVVSWLMWFLLACLLHSVVDILTHVDDGPVLFFPFEWTIRFQSPVSYWDSNHYGTQFSRFEVALDLLLVFYLSGPRVWRWISTRRANMIAEPPQ
ncbi:MAG: zinc dependent phospholipase C family protein [Candidatus Tectomicrobia bacterium]|nr:zinc dependent phospholipase C family protein [Candidatus Tectomicrobia bacterium]